MRSGAVDVSFLALIPSLFLHFLIFFFLSPVFPVPFFQPDKIKDQMMTVAATIKLDLDDDEPKKEEKEQAAEASTREE